ncbi:MAG: glycosyltransferase 87 family protein [Halobacteriales archaeon]
MAALDRLWSLRRERPVFVAASLGLLAFYAVYPFVDAWLRSIGVAPAFAFWDFGAYGGGVNRWLDGAPIYQQNADGGYHQSFLYPPVVLLVFVPFLRVLPGLLGWLDGLLGGVVLLGPVVGALASVRPAVLWIGTSALLLWVALLLVVRELGLGLSTRERLFLLWLLLGFQPLLLAVKMGQMAPFLVGLLSLSFVGILRGEEKWTGNRDGRLAAFASGAATAVVGITKLTYAFAGAHLLADRDRMTGAVATGIALLAVSLLVFGVDIHVTYLDVLAWGIGQGSSARTPALWLAPYYKPLFWIPGSLAVRILAALLVSIGAVLAARDAIREVFALGVAAIPLFSPLTYTYYLVALLPAVVVLLAGELDRDGRPALLLAGLFLASIHSYGLKFVVDVLPELLGLGSALRPVYPLLQPGLWGNAIIVGIAAVRVAQAARLSELASEPATWEA